MPIVGGQGGLGFGRRRYLLGDISSIALTWSFWRCSRGREPKWRNRREGSEVRRRGWIRWAGLCRTG